MSYREFYMFLGSTLAIATIAGCGSEGDELPPAVNGAYTPEVNGAANLAEPPPMVVSSPSYRCDDGKALYVDVLTDENAVNVRDTRQDLPTRLTREGGEGPFTADGRSLSGVGDEVRYSAPDRPDQSCRAAAA